ncbi:MAG: AAA family ATPase [Candidatus Jacksonbacteria bacterium]|nr:AAA family ATPase [Candidatus Jacksonbacteria bacterium]
MSKNIFTRPAIFIVVGPPGSGKETQADKLEEFLLKDNPSLGVIRNDNGTLLREAIENPSYTEHMRNIIKESVLVKGESVPGAIATDMMVQTLLRKNDGKSHIIFEGILRKENELPKYNELMHYVMPESHRYFIRLGASDNVLEQRLLNRKGKDGLKRADDNHETIKNRIDVYRIKTDIIMESLKDNPDYIFLNIDATPPIEEVHKNIIETITLRA